MLETNVKKSKQGKTIEEKAKHFSRLVWDNEKKQALQYFSELKKKEQLYIQIHKDYKWDLKAAQMSGI